MSKFIKPFRMGDVVRRKSGRTPHIIHEVNLSTDDGSLSYSTNCGAWYDHEDFTLVRECDAKSMAELLKDIRKEEDYEEEDYE